MILGFRRDVEEIHAPLGYYKAYSGNSVPTLWDNLLVPSWPLKMGPKVYPEALVRKYSTDGYVRSSKHNYAFKCLSA